MSSLLEDKVIRFFVLSVMVVAFQFCAFIRLANMDCFCGVRSLMVAFPDALLVMLPYLLLPRKWRWTMWIVLTVITLWQLSNVWYSRTYMELMPFGSYLLFNNVNSMLVSSVFGILRVEDLLILLPPVGLYLIYRKRYKRSVLSEASSRRKIIIAIMASVVVVLLAQFRYSYVYYSDFCKKEEKGHLCRNFWGITGLRLSECGFTRNCYYMTNGFVAYVFHYMTDFAPERELSEQEKNDVDAFVSSLPENSDMVISENDGKNLIFIVVESLNSWVVDYGIGDKKVAPTLNMIYNDTSNYVVKNVVSQVCNGRSSDSHFIYNTGVLPSRNIVTAIDFGDVSYPSIAKALKQKGYSAFEVIGDCASYNNQNVTYSSYGFDDVVDISNYIKRENFGKIDVDGAVFSNAIEAISVAQQPFCAMVVTLTMHNPYDKIAPCPSWIANCDGIPTQARNYLSLVYTFDVQLKRFIEELKRIGIYDNSVIVITGDHNDYDKNLLECRDERTPGDCVIPFVVINGGKSGEYVDFIGQIDVYPTLLDLMGANQYSWKGMGRSLFRTPAVTSAIDKRGNVVGFAASEEVVEAQREAWRVGELMIVSRYFDDKGY